MTRIEQASSSTAEAAAQVLAAAFVDDATIAALIPPTATNRPQRLARMFLAEMHSCGLQNVDVLVRAVNSDVVAAAVWSAPRNRTPALTATKWALISFSAMGMRGFKAAREYDSAAKLHRPDEPHWHLLDIGSSPEARGIGAGVALLEHRLADVDASGAPATLEATTEASRRLYERFGFRAVAQLPAHLGGAHVMVRPGTLARV